MGFLDRWRRRKEPHRRRSYAAAGNSRLFADWVMRPVTADAELRKDLRSMRARSRDLAQNNDHAKKFLKMVATNVIGPKGIQLQAAARDLDKKPDAGANETIEAAWAAWGKFGVCTVDGCLSWVDAQRLFIETVARDGEAIAVKTATRENPFGFALQFMEADHLDEQHNVKLGNGNMVRMGVETNAARRPVAYHFLTEHPGADVYEHASQRYVRIPAERVIHAFLRERPTQSRGVPWMHTAMTRLQMLAGYEEAELVAARTAAAKMGFFTSPDGEGFTGDDKIDGNVITEASPGTFDQLPAGAGFTPWDPQHPTAAFEAFEKAVLRGIASGLNVSYASLASDLTDVNYSSIRQGVLDERDQWRSIQGWMIGVFCEPVFQAWLAMALTTGALALPMRKIEKFSNVLWVPRGWQWIDPEKDTAAGVMQVSNNLNTMTNLLAERGENFEDVLAQRVAEREMIKAAGLEPKEEGKPANAQKN